MRHRTAVVTISMGAGASGSAVIRAEERIDPRVSLISAEEADIVIEFSDLDVLDDPEHDSYGLGGAQMNTWQTGITLVANTLFNSTTPAHVATSGLQVAYLVIEWDNDSNPAADLHVFISSSDENG